MTCLIFGINGYIGKFLSEFFICEGINVIGVYNRNIPKSNNLEIISKNEVFKLNPKTVDYIVYAAGNFSSTYSELIEINTHYLNRISKYFKESKLLFISSTNVYGIHNSIIDEFSGFNSPTIYGLAKLSGEFIVKNHPQNAILRLTYVYGPNLNNGSFLPNIINQAIQSKRILLFGKGEREQNYINIFDVLDLCKKILKKESNRIYLGVGQQSYSNKYIAKCICSILKDVKIEYTGNETGYSSYYNGNYSYKYLDWIPKVSISHGIKEMINASTNLW